MLSYDLWNKEISPLCEQAQEAYDAYVANLYIDLEKKIAANVEKYIGKRVLCRVGFSKTEGEPFAYVEETGVITCIDYLCADSDYDVVINVDLDLGIEWDHPENVSYQCGQLAYRTICLTNIIEVLDD